MNIICSCCHKNIATQKHHKFPQRAWAKKLYRELIHDNRNLQDVCSGCHVENPSPKLIHWSEQEFCTAMAIGVRSKIGRDKIYTGVI